MERANKPLTLEQLKQMNGRPVWWWNKSQKPTVTICLFDRFSKEPHFVSYDFVVEDSTKISKYSLIRRWGYLPYASDPTAQQPAHIDREKWGMCEYCSGKRVLYQHTNSTKLFVDTFGSARTIVTECNACPPHADCCMNGIPANSAFLINFCPHCGRPLTEEAWAELERRLMG